ncbi:cytochrome P450- family 709- subfamily B-polypeptide 2 [Striga hermonthica]|uniref:Cytochrome P450- family 709- subfamily B-polypeptide 2 n=1 Tax=Striga hermonthica TaxID=68872 RepID=A0A9N7REC1_STRHE|nr:cytochrome P450- family 709- subfamily B-polypeptide 2 [Striga hermonthica]
MRKEASECPYELWQHDMFPIVLPHLNKWKKSYGNNFLIWIGRQPQIFITEPELVKEVLSNKDVAHQKPRPASPVRKLFGDGLILAEGEKWTRLRKLSNYAFHGDSLKDMVPAMVASVESMLGKWANDEDNTIDISNEFRLLTSDVISRTAFGSSYVEGKTIFEKLGELSVLVYKTAFKTRIPGIEKIWRSREEIESDKIEQSLRSSILSLVRKREDSVRTGQAENFGSDFLGSLVRVHNDHDPESRFSVDDIVDECKVFYVAGHETTTSLLCWVTFLLSVYTDWQEKAREEVFQVFAREKPTSDGIARLKTLTMIINEASRLYSPVVHLARTVRTKTKLGRYELPPNVDVVVTPLSLHTNPELWGEDAAEFNPERFADGLSKATNGNSFAFIPFGAGPRVCVGSNFAVNETKIALSMILQRYKLKVSKDYVHSPFQFLTVSPRYGIPIVLQPL